jgi:hypothetical protein
MPQQQIIWTVLPNGRKQNGATEKLMLSVVASLRLRLDDGGTGVLQSFPDFLDWPARIRQSLTSIDLIVDDDEAHPIATAIVTGQPAQPAPSDLWKALFAATTPVRSQQFEGFQQPISTYSVSGVAAQLQAGYTGLAHDAPFRPADKATFKQSFANLATGPSPIVTAGLRTMSARLPQVHTLSADELADMHRGLSASLLHPDPDMSFDDKLAGIARVAGALARSAPTGQPVSLVADTDDPASAFAQFAAFHRRPASVRPDSASAAVPPNNDIDFHRALTALGEYSWLMRRLGLIIDLEVDASRVPKSSIGVLRRLRARPHFSSPATDASGYTPFTKYILDNDMNGPLPFPVFLAAPRAAATPATIQSQFEIVAGFLNLGLTRPPPPPTDDLQFDVFNVDVDGAATKVLNTIQMFAGDSGTQATPIDASAEIAAPALQTSGLMLARTGQAKALVSDVATARTQEDDRLAGRRAVLFAEDLVRGYRIDVRRFPPGFRPGVDPEPPWMSLHRRTGDFRFKRDGASDLPVLGIADEGFVQPVVAQDRNGGDANPIYIHEYYAHWQGWSLSAPFPADPVGLTRGQSDMPAVPAGLKQVEVSVQAAPATLPRLRFGHSYQMRVRTVDLAGNGLTLDGAQAVLDILAQQARPEVFLPIKGQQLPYRRFDPIASPVLVLREELTAGEAIDVMVIRSNGPGTTTASYAVDLHDPLYHGFNDRHIAPPKSSQRMAERHGRFDAAFGVAGQPQSIFPIFGRGPGTLNDTSIINIRTGQPEDLPNVVRTDGTGAQSTIPHGLRFIAADQAQGPTSGYTVHYEEQLRLPYLPDPLADGAALFGLPGVKKTESLVLVESATPGVAGTLQSRSGDQQLLPQPAIDALGVITKIGFPSAAQWPELRCFRLRLDGGLDPNGETPTWSEVDGVRTLTVRLAPAEVSTIFISTYPRQDDVKLFGMHFAWSRLGAPEGDRDFIQLAQHGALAMLTPARKVVLVHAVQQPLIEPRVDGTQFAANRFPGDTVAYLAGRFKIHGKSTEKLDLLASWTEPLQESEGTRSIETHVLEVPISLGDPDPLGTQGDPVPIATYTKAPTDSFQFNGPPNQSDARARSFLARHEFGDTRHRHVTYRLVATTRFKEYFPESITRDPANLVRVATFEFDVLNSVTPPALQITSIVPAFQWDRSLDRTSSTRLGGWLRVYLGSKWFMTGEGEALAVVGDVSADGPAAGADPLHATTSSADPVVLIPKATPVTIAGQKIYPFAVHHDDEAGLWYADLAFDVTGLYFPFVSLKLARFQQQSLPGLQLSKIVDAGFYQLAPDRAATLNFIDVVAGQPDKRKIEIKMSGPRAAAAVLTTGAHLGYSVEVGIEERALGAPGDQRDPHLGWKPSTTIVPTVVPPSPDSGVLWQGSVIVPAVPDMDRRIVIKEFEIFPPDDPPPGQAWSGEQAGAPRRRLVYADAIAVR